MAHRRPYLVRRGHSLHFRIAVPADLRSAIGQREIVQSLSTQNTSEGAPAALELAAAVLRLFHELRQDRSMPIDKGKLRGLVKTTKLEIANSDLREELDAQASQHAAEIMRLRAGAELIRLRAENEALRKPPATPAPTGVSNPVEDEDGAPTAAAAPRGRPKGGRHLLADAIPVWKRLKKPSPATIEIYEAEAERFQARHPGMVVGDIQKKHIREYVRHLQEDLGLSAKSVEKAHGAVRALLTIAEHQEWVPGNVAKGAMLPKDTAPRQRGFTAEELQAIFNDPVFTAGKRPTAAKGEAAFWLPLLLLLTGARREELAQLTVDDIKVKDGVDVISINPTDDDGRTKTEQSRRLVPIHHELRRLGFLRYVADRRRAGDRQLFPALKRNKRGQLGAKWGDWWGRYLRGDIGIKDERISPAHSFRHTFITECRRLRMGDDEKRALVGHTEDAAPPDAHGDYGEVPLDTLAEWVNQVNFRGLDLSRVVAG